MNTLPKWFTSKLKELDDKQNWWLKSFQNELDYLTNN